MNEEKIFECCHHKKFTLKELGKLKHKSEIIYPFDDEFEKKFGGANVGYELECGCFMIDDKNSDCPDFLSDLNCDKNTLVSWHCWKCNKNIVCKLSKLKLQQTVHKANCKGE